MEAALTPLELCIHSLVDGHWVTSTFLIIMKNAAMNIRVHSCTVLFKVFCEHDSFSSYLGVELLGHMLTPCFTVGRTAGWSGESSRTVFHSHPPCVMRVLISPCPCQHLLLSVFDYSRAGGETHAAFCHLEWNLDIIVLLSWLCTWAFISLATHAFLTLYGLASVVVVHEELSVSTGIFCREMLTSHYQTHSLDVKCTV